MSSQAGTMEKSGQVPLIKLANDYSTYFKIDITEEVRLYIPLYRV